MTWVFVRGQGGGGLDSPWDLNVTHASYFKSASNPSIRF